MSERRSAGQYGAFCRPGDPGRCRELGLEHLPLVSRAYHDSLFMAGIAPTGMIFIPCKDGISHRPEEHCEPDAIARGVEVLALTLRELSKE